MTYDQIITYFGNAANAARALGITTASVAGWRKRDEVPIGRQYQVEVMSSGKLVADRSNQKQAA